MIVKHPMEGMNVSFYCYPEDSAHCGQKTRPTASFSPAFFAGTTGIAVLPRVAGGVVEPGEERKFPPAREIVAEGCGMAVGRYPASS